MGGSTAGVRWAPRRRGLLVGAVAVVALLALLLVALPPTPSTAASPSPWPTYHHDLARTGVDPSQPTFASLSPAWTTPVDGLVYAEPLFAPGVNGHDLVVVATENDSLYALDGTTGHAVWGPVALGAPVPGSALPCGDISPVGITSTPAIDLVANVVYAVAFQQPVSPHHELYAVSLADGTVLFHRPVDPTGVDPTFDPKVQNQRGALALSGGRVYVPFGGRAGDCGTYHGWLVSAPAGSAAGSLTAYEVPTNQVPNDRGGAIWTPPGPTTDATGTLYVATGNGFSTTTFDHGESVIRLSPALSEQDFWAPADWATLNGSDRDIGSVGPTLLGNDLLFQTGKNGTGYLLQASHLGGIGGQRFTAAVCALGAWGGTAYAAPFVYVPCRDRLVALSVDTGSTNPSFSIAWQQPGLAGQPAAGSPIVAGGAVWTIDIGHKILYAYDGATGAVRHQASLAGPVNFATPASGGGHIFVPDGPQIVAFALVANVLLGDINQDGIVDIRDYGIWRQQFGATGCGNPADLNGDCVVDIRDYGIWRANFGATAGAARRGETAPAPRSTRSATVLGSDHASTGN
jgi:outer membrane protein assembly factor BamB